MKPTKTSLTALLAGLAVLAMGMPLRSAEHLAARLPVVPAGVKRLEAPGILNLFALGTNVFSGSTPAGAEGFAALAKLGVKTIISVDGAAPDAAMAGRYGLRYVHLPHGYDGVSPQLQLLLAKAGRELPGPIYVHCHHGKHRGPAAAAVICLANQGWSPQQAAAFLATAGTATHYAGLYQTVREFQLPTSDQIQAMPANFPERARVSGLTDAMVEIDARWEHLQEVRAAGYRALEEHPDIEPVNEAVILREHYREAQRLPETAKQGADMLARFKSAEHEVREAERLLRLFKSGGNTELKGQLDRAFDALAKSCSACHEAYRDPAGIKSKP